MPPAPRAPSPRKAPAKEGGGTKRESTPTAREGEESSTARAEGKTKKLGSKRGAVPKKKNTDRGGGGGGEESVGPEVPQAIPDRVRVFLKISSDTAQSVSSCVTCDPKTKSAWALDFDGQRAGQPVTLDGVYSADNAEQSMYPEVINNLVNEFIQSPRGVGCLLTYGQGEAGKETLMYGEAGSRINMTPRTLPAPGHAPQQRAPGLVLAAFRAALAHLPSLQETVRARPRPRPRPRSPSRARARAPRWRVRRAHAQWRGHRGRAWGERGEGGARAPHLAPRPPTGAARTRPRARRPRGLA